ncbi:putative ATP-BINDING CASSETTE TRANSPORTER [Babesia divergens]|uniref:ATP-BINDING CASSETTE TRANSPORTER n=1 Tax=Babesia divergens TaxID=32595 RepID=A0AAD9G825_BABDI|nr:putative ATP-BINDING CASSETTE TRANSPORTER [Babesia divergens]
MTKKTYRLKSFETSGLFSLIFFGWVHSWMQYLCDEFVHIDELHPLPKSDEISYWQPIFSKHISDGLLRLEKSEYEKANPDESGKLTKPYRHIILRALFLTFWRRGLIVLFANVLMNTIAVGTSLLLKHLVGLMAAPNRSLYSIVGMILVIVGVEFVCGVLSQHILYYFERVHVNMESVLTVTLFQHGMCHRRAYSSATYGCSVMEGCKGVVHSWPCEDSGCSSNPLKCPARRHQNKELSPSMYVYLFVDIYHIVCMIDAVVEIVRLLCTVVMSMVVISKSMGVNVLGPCLIIIGLVVSMILIEVANGHAWLHTLQSKDDRVARTTEAITHLNVLKVMGIEDVAYSMIQNSRDDEMMVIKTRTGLHSINIYLNSILGVCVLLFVLLDYVRSLESSTQNGTFDLSTPITVMFLIDKITAASITLPKTLKTVVEATTSIARVEKFLRTCSPNFYLKRRADSAPKEMEGIQTLEKEPKGISSDTVVQFQNAAFTWTNSREDLLSGKNCETPLLTNIDFEVKRGDIKIITGVVASI